MRRILFAGGGTGGHLFPAFAIAEEFRRRLGDGIDIRFFVTGRELEMKLIRERGFKTQRIHVRGLRRGSLVRNLLFFPLLALGILEALTIIVRLNPDLVIGTGGYLSYPVVLAAKMTNRPAFLQEQNSYVGIATRRLARHADLIFVAYEQSVPQLKWAEKCVLSGNPVNPLIGAVEADAALRKFGLDPHKRTLLVIGGSQGAASINEKIAASLTEFSQTGDTQIIWQTGAHPHFAEVFRLSGAAGVCLPFIDDMPAAYAASDLVLCRGGALTLSEIAVAGKPAIIVPYPHATDDHQTKNAQSLVDAGAAVLVPDAQLQSFDLTRLVRQLLDDEKKRMAMSISASALGHRGAAEAIVQRIHEYMGWP